MCFHDCFHGKTRNDCDRKEESWALRLCFFTYDLWHLRISCADQPRSPNPHKKKKERNKKMIHIQFHVSIIHEKKGVSWYFTWNFYHKFYKDNLYFLTQSKKFPNFNNILIAKFHIAISFRKMYHKTKCFFVVLHHVNTIVTLVYFIKIEYKKELQKRWRFLWSCLSFVDDQYFLITFIIGEHDIGPFSN